MAVGAHYISRNELCGRDFEKRLSGGLLGRGGSCLCQNGFSNIDSDSDFYHLVEVLSLLCFHAETCGNASDRK